MESYEKLGFVRLDKTKLVQYTFLDNLTEIYTYFLTKEMHLNSQKGMKR